MRPLLDYLIVKTPIIALVEPDVRWAHRVIEEAKDGLGSSAGAELEWSLSEGWKGTQDLLHQSGLSSVSTFRTGRSPVKPLGQLKTWLASSRDVSPNTPFQDGVAVFYDFEGFLDEPAIGRLINDLVGLFAAHGATAIMVLPHRVPVDHSMISAVTHVRPTEDPVLRYREVLEGVLRELGEGVGGNLDIEAACSVLSGLSISEAETAVRLAALDHMRGEADRPLLEHLDRARGEFEGLVAD